MVERVTRRAALGTLGLTGAVGVGMLASSDPAVSAPAPAPPPTPSGRLSMASWLATRGQRYVVAHRGSGDVYPEHSLAAYRAAVAWGAQCLEISVAGTSDGTLICMHDATYDRTTTATGKISELPASILRGVGIRAPQLGPAWTTPPLPAVPLFDEVLTEFGGRVILAMEAKDDTVYPAMLAAVSARGLTDSIMVKAYYTSKRIAEAKQAGLPVFAYLGAADEFTAAGIDATTAQLKTNTDAFIIPAYSGKGFVPDDLVAKSVRTGISVWAGPLHRRADAEHFFALGVAGVVASSYGYVATRKPLARMSSWRYQSIAPGEMSKDPSGTAFAPGFAPDGEITLAAQKSQHFLTLGQFCPLPDAESSYTVEVQVSFPTLPTDRSAGVVLAFGHTDDAYYQLRSGLGGGYHALLRADGRLGLFAHQPGVSEGNNLGERETPAPEIGQWVTLRLEVSPTTVVLQRPDSGTEISANNSTHRGGYLHLGRSSTDGAAAFRNFSIG